MDTILAGALIFAGLWFLSIDLSRGLKRIADALDRGA